MPEYTTPGVYVQESSGPQPIEGVATSTAAFLGATARGPLRPTLVTSFAEFASAFGGDVSPDAYMPDAVRGFFDNGGGRLVVARVVRGDAAHGPLTVQDYEGEPTAARAEPQGLAALSSDDYAEVALVYAPGSTFDVARRLIEHCEAMRYRFAIIDGPPAVPAGFDPHRAVAASSRAALYVPWLLVADKTGARKPRRVPPGGHVAGIYARTDRDRGVFKAPANEALAGAVGLTAIIDHAQQETLNPAGVNVIREFSEAGRQLRVWGARTLGSDAEFKYVNVRRLLIYLEHSISRGTRWAVFEANAEPLWARIRRDIGDFLRRAWRDGALQGRTEAEAYFVRCDRTTMTQDDVAQGRLICVVGVAIVKPAEYVNVRIEHRTAAA